MTKFIAQELSLDQAGALRPLLARIARVDKSLADQLRRAAASVTLNLAEGRGRAGADRRYSFRVAHGSHHELRAALDLAVAFGYLDADDVAPVAGIADRLGGMLYSLAK